MPDLDHIHARLSQFPIGGHAFLEGRFYSYDYESGSYLDRTADFYSGVVAREGLSDPDINVVRRAGTETYYGGEGGGHGSSGFVARFDGDTLTWLVHHGLNPVEDIELIDDLTLRWVSNHEHHYELPRNLTLDDLDRFNPG